METSSKNSFVDNNDNFRIYNKKRKHSISFEIIYDKYKNEFIDNCEEILIQKEEDYLNFFFSRMKRPFFSTKETLVANFFNKSKS